MIFIPKIPAFLSFYLITYYYGNKGLDLADLRRYSEAVNEFNNAIKLEPENPYYHYSKARALNALKKYKEAESEFRESIGLEPGNSEFHFGRAEALNELKLYEEAIKEYSISIQLEPNYMEAYYNMGLILSKLGRYKDAIKEFDEAIRLKPDNPGSYYNKAVALKHLGHYNDALNSISIIYNTDEVNIILIYTELMFLLRRDMEARKLLSEVFDEGNITEEDLCEALNDQLQDKNSREEEKVIKTIMKIYCK